MRGGQIIYLVSLLLAFACKEVVQVSDARDWSAFFPQEERRAVSAFIENAGFDPMRSGMSTSERRVEGIALVEFSEDGSNRVYQDDSWRSHGRMGPIVVDEDGHVITAAVPMVNLEMNMKAEQNNLYRIDAETGIMGNWFRLPRSKAEQSINPFGVLGLAYDYEHRVLYVSSVYASDPRQEKGVVYSLKVGENQAQIIDSIVGIDVFGIGYAKRQGGGLLFLGHARSGDVYSINVDEAGRFELPLRFEFTIEDVNRDALKAQKIRVVESNSLKITAAAFDFNLAPREDKDLQVLEQSWDANSGKWLNKNLQDW